MTRITVNDDAFDDPRFALLAHALPCLHDRWHALGCSAHIWHMCASRHTNTIRPAELAECLGVAKPLSESAQKLAVDAFVTIADLGTWVGDVIRVRGIGGTGRRIDDVVHALTTAQLAEPGDSEPSTEET